MQSLINLILKEVIKSNIYIYKLKKIKGVRKQILLQWILFCKKR
jgi:hypothetical protein